MPKGKKKSRTKWKILDLDAVPDTGQSTYAGSETKPTKSSELPSSVGSERATVQKVHNADSCQKPVKEQNTEWSSIVSSSVEGTADATCVASPNTDYPIQKKESTTNSHTEPEKESPNTSDCISRSKGKETPVGVLSTAPDSSAQPKKTISDSEEKNQPIVRSKVPKQIPLASPPSHKERIAGGGKTEDYRYHEKGYGRHNKGYGDNGPHERHEVRQRSEQETFRLSKALATLLRHGYPNDIRLDDCGYAKVDDIVRHPFFRKFHTNLQEITEIVEQNDKKRFQMSKDSQRIRAVQGHSKHFKETNIGMTPITDAFQFQNVFHGTYKQYWPRIKKEGLKKMTRTHIHFAIGDIHDDHVISGMKWDSEIIIKLDLAEALKDGLKFFLSSNNVILAQGDEHGIIHPKYFKLYKIWNDYLGVYQPSSSDTF